MLTDSELAWLDARRGEPFSFCNHCWTQLAPYCAGSPRCPLTTLGTELYDAIEFEQRVAAKLASFDTWDPCKHGYLCPYSASPHRTCAWCHIRTARLEVEEEMDANRKRL